MTAIDQLHTYTESPLADVLYRRAVDTKPHTLYHYLVHSQRNLIEHIYTKIQLNDEMKCYTNHGTEHIRRIETRVIELIDTDKVDVHELYLLSLAIWYHDAALFKQRYLHSERISEIYDEFSFEHGYSTQEKRIVQELVKAHTEGEDGGGQNRLQGLAGPTSVSFLCFDMQINVIGLAAILRIADELSEGPSRTNRELLQLVARSYPDSLKHHMFSRLTTIALQKSDKRILVTCQFPLYIVSNELEVGVILQRAKNQRASMKFVDYMRYIEERIIKMEEERCYCGHFSQEIDHFRNLSITFLFYDGDDFTLPLMTTKFALSTHIVPGSKLVNIWSGCEPVTTPSMLREQLTAILTSRGS